MAALWVIGARARSDGTWLSAEETTATTQPDTLRAAPARNATPARRRYVESELVMAPRYERGGGGSSGPPRDRAWRQRACALGTSTDAVSALVLLLARVRVEENEGEMKGVRASTGAAFVWALCVAAVIPAVVLLVATWGRQLS